ncbi:MAG TPA: TetR/AcrR family transcriptional regulator [Mycobacterium sp.]|jgi:AcrR family transcriptional regulator
MSEATAGQPERAEPANRRSARAHAAILTATTELLTEAGYGALTIEGVAARAGVGKTTVYRRWPTKPALVIEAIRLALPTLTPTDTGDLRNDLLIAVRGVMYAFAHTPVGAVIPALAADVMTDPQQAEQFRNQLIRPRRSAVDEILHRAAARGELPPDADTDVLLDVYAGAVFYRILISGEPVTDLLAEQLVDLLLNGKTPVKPHPDDPEARTA